MGHGRQLGRSALGGARRPLLMRSFAVLGACTLVLLAVARSGVDELGRLVTVAVMDWRSQLGFLPPQ